MDNKIIQSFFFCLIISLGLIQTSCLNPKTSSEIQLIAKETLSEKVLQVSADSGLIIIMEVNFGKILADISVVNKDSSIIKITESGTHSRPEGFGGLIQPFALMAALESGNITMKDSVDTKHGLFIYNGHRILDSNYEHGGFGKIEVSNVLPMGSDIGVFRSLTRAFKEHQADYFYHVNKIVSDLPFMTETFTGDSATQYLPAKEYGLQLNPTQVLVLYNTLANNGEMVYDGKVLNPSIVSPTTLANIRGALQKVVSPEGTGRLALSDKMSVAGKTGSYIDATGLSGIVVTRTDSFCGYFPVKKPKFTCLVMIYSNKGKSNENKTIAVQILKKLAENIMPINR